MLGVLNRMLHVLKWMLLVLNRMLGVLNRMKKGVVIQPSNLMNQRHSAPLLHQFSPISPTPHYRNSTLSTMKVFHLPLIPCHSPLCLASEHPLYPVSTLLPIPRDTRRPRAAHLGDGGAGLEGGRRLLRDGHRRRLRLAAERLQAVQAQTVVPEQTAEVVHGRRLQHGDVQPCQVRHSTGVGETCVNETQDGCQRGTRQQDERRGTTCVCDTGQLWLISRLTSRSARSENSDEAHLRWSGISWWSLHYSAW